MKSRKVSTRGESVVVSYVLMLGVMTVLSALLISAAGGFLSTKNDEVTQTQAEITTEAIGAEIEEVDKNARRIDANSSSKGFYKYSSDAEDLIGQYPYKVSIENTSKQNTYTIIVSVQSVSITEKTNVTLYTIDNVVNNTLSSGSSLTYIYQTGGNLTLSDEDFDENRWSINTSGDYIIPDGTTFDAGIKTRNNGNVFDGEDSTIYGSIASNGTVNTDNRLLVFGSIRAKDSIELNPETTVTKVVKSGNIIQIGENSTVGKNVSANEEVIVYKNSTVHGSIGSVNSDVAVGENVTVNSQINSDSDIVVEKDSFVRSNISANSQVRIQERTEVKSTIKANEVILYDDVTVTDDVVVPMGSNLICNGVGITINGQSCSDYKNNNY